MDIAVEISHISKNFGKVLALDDISCTIKQGEIFGFIGPDGAGKTTLFRILTTLLLPSKGKATVDGMDVISNYMDIRKNVGYMPGKFSLYQDMSVEENLAFFAGVFKSSIQENYYLIEDIYNQIKPFKDRRVAKLSGGMKQKLALSCALIHKPKVLFLDEPTTGVDAVSRKEFWEMLNRLKTLGITIVVSTPYMDEAVLCDRVALLQKGKILSVNTPSEIENNYPHTLYGISSKDMFKLISQLKNMKIVHSSYLFGEKVHLALKEGASINSIEEELYKQGVRDIEYSEIKAGIEDCFMELMIN